MTNAQLVFDARHMALPFTGLGRYTASLLRTLLHTKRRTDFRIDVLLHTNPDWTVSPYFAWLSQQEQLGNCGIHFIDAPPFSLRHHYLVSTWVNRRSPEAYFYPHFDPPIGLRVPTTFTVHDLLPLVVPGYIKRFVWFKKRYFAYMLKFAIRRAVKCFAVSESTRRDVIGLVGEAAAAKVEVVYEGPTLETHNSNVTPLTEHTNGSYLLYVGDRRPHKCLKRLLDIFYTLRRDHAFAGKLLLVGPTRSFGFDVDAYAHDRGDVIVLGNVSDDELSSLYANAEAVVLLSEYEGFGLPVVEAARFKAKVVVSDGGSLPEIAPPWALVVPRAQPRNTAAARLAQYLRAPQHINNAAYLERFSWEAASRKMFPTAY
jgi:glycosyltransferase involved in cell wall biosynthesis